MFTKIDIEKFGLFNDFRWSNSLDIFKKVNIIYGRNYSGKTTLSRIFRCIETGELHKKYLDGKFNLIDNENNTVTQDNLTCQYKVRVYNKDFISKNLSWLHDDLKGEIEAFTLLGSENIAAKQRIEEIENELGNIEKKTGLLYQQEQKKLSFKKEHDRLERIQKEVTDLLTQKANRELKQSTYFVKQGTTYNITNIKDEIAAITNSSKNFILSEEEKELHKKTIDEAEKKPTNEIPVSKIKLSEYITTVKPLVEKKITLTNTIQDLLTNNILQEWVNKGRDHHRGQRDYCAFCGQKIPTLRWEELDAHFSKESEDLKENIQKEIQILNNSKSSLEKFLETKGVIKDNYYYSYHFDFDDIKKQWDNFAEQYNIVISLLNDKLQKRYDDIFNPEYFDDDAKKIIDDVNIEKIASDFERIIELFNGLSKGNNAKSDALGKDKDTSRTLLRYSEIQNFITTVNYKKKLEDIAKETIQLNPNYALEKKGKFTG